MNNKEQEYLRDFDPGQPVQCLTSVFKARRDLVRRLKKVMDGFKLSVEEADLLILLFEAYVIREPNKAELPTDEDGYVAVTDIRDTLGYNPALLSRRLLVLKSPKMIEIVPARDRDLPFARRRAIHGNTAFVCITEDGIYRLIPLWAKVKELAKDLLSDVSPQELEAHVRINSRISAGIRKIEGKELIPGKRSEGKHVATGGGE